MYSIIAKLPTSSPTPLRGTMHLLNGTLDVVTMFSQSSMGRGCAAISFHHQQTETSLIRLVYAGGSVFTGRLHMFTCSRITCSLQPRKLVRLGIIGKANLLDRYYVEGVPFAVCLPKGEGRKLSRYAALIAAGHWLNAPPPTLPFSCHHYNDETERQRW